MSRVCSADRPDVHLASSVSMIHWHVAGMLNKQPISKQNALRGKTFNVGHYAHFFNQFIFIFAMLIGTKDFCHFILLSLILTLPGGHKVSAKQNTLASFSRTCFI